MRSTLLLLFIFALVVKAGTHSSASEPDPDDVKREQFDLLIFRMRVGLGVAIAVAVALVAFFAVHVILFIRDISKEREIKKKATEEERLERERRNKEIQEMYEEWRAGKGITKYAYKEVNPLPDPNYLVAERGTVVESAIPFVVIDGYGEVVVSGRRPRATPNIGQPSTNAKAAPEK